MTQDTAVLKQRAQKILDELTGEKNGTGLTFPAKGMVSALVDQVTGNDKDLLNDAYIVRFIFDTAQTIIMKSWEKTGDIINLLPPYGFRNDEAIPQWAYWFSSHKRRTLSVNRFLREVQGTDINKSVFDMMYETVRYEQKNVAAEVIRFLSDDDRWRHNVE